MLFPHQRNRVGDFSDFAVLNLLCDFLELQCNFVQKLSVQLKRPQGRKGVFRGGHINGFQMKITFQLLLHKGIFPFHIGVRAFRPAWNGNLGKGAAVFGRCAPEYFFEFGVERFDVLKTAVGSNVQYFFVGLLQGKY